MSGFPILATSALKGSMILFAAGGLAWVLRKRSAAVRHLVWTAAAAALLALPFLNLTLPALRVIAPASAPLAIFQAFSSSATLPSPHSGPFEAGQQPLSRHSAATRDIDLRAGVVAVWIAGAAAGILQMLFAFAALRRIRRSARAFDSRGIVKANGVEILESGRCGMPMTFGVLRPVVMLPEGAADWNPERLRCVLLHEIAHVRRGDVATHLLARTALALYWWNPLAWYAWRQFLKERERATDDLVLHAGARASAYAGHLLEVARSLEPVPATAWAAIAMARRSELEGRLIAILDSNVNRTPSRRRSAIAAAVLAIVIAAPFAAIQAQDPGLPPELDATIRTANAQRNHELLDNAAAAYEKIARYDVAHQLLQNSLAMRQQASGSGSAAYAAGLVKLGDLAVTRRQLSEAAGFYAKAVALGDRPEVAPALLYLGMDAFDSGQQEQAEELFQRVLRVQPIGETAGRALSWLAVLKQSTRGGQYEAESYYQRAIDQLGASPATFNTLNNYARLLRSQNRIFEADQMEARAGKVRATSAEASVSSKGVYRVGGGVTSPGLIHKVEPAYTEAARTAKLQGTVLLYVEVQADGTAANFRVVRSLDPGLDQKAIEAVRQWRFRPGRKDGIPVPVAATIEINFRLL